MKTRADVSEMMSSRVCIHIGEKVIIEGQMKEIAWVSHVAHQFSYYINFEFIHLPKVTL